MILPREFQKGVRCGLESKKYGNNSFSGNKEDCEFTSSRVFSSRKKELKRARKYIIQQGYQNNYYNDHETFISLPKTTTKYNSSQYSSVHYRKSRHRVKRDRTLLAVQADPKNNRLWPKWCKKLAYFRVFQYDYTLCLYINDFKNDPILAFSDPFLGVTSYGYGYRKSFDKIGKFLS